MDRPGASRVRIRARAYLGGEKARLRSRATSKQSRKKSALILASQFGALFDYGTLLLSFFYFKTGANELVNLKWDEEVTFGELSIDVIVRISIPNETYDLKENFTVPAESGITCLQKDECSTTHSRIF